MRCNSCGSFRNENGEDVALRVSILEKENMRFRKALEKYADSNRHSMDPDGFVWSGDYFDYKTARDALKGNE